MGRSPQNISDLVERFQRNREAYRSPDYKEARVRAEFIDPMFEALGWDMGNKAGYAEPYKDVIHEDAIKIGGATEAPDYCFRIGGTRKFFLEAKKPSVNIGGDISPAYQLRRYAWSSKLALSILTDFEEFAVYDCRIRPKPNDKVATARTVYMRFDEYLDRWDEIASVFGKEAVLQGSFDKYAEGAKRKRGTSEVDREFLDEIETWRTAIARNLALRNGRLSVRDLNFAVQRTVDRIIFLRMCEDRGIEPYGQLLALVNGPHIYKRLVALYHRADERYNSGLFHFHREKDRTGHPDELTPDLKIDDKVLKSILVPLYYPDCPYEFSVLPPEILGNVYEQFLGKVIRLTKGHQARVEEKPEVKKAGGVYYTPQYIVKYIVAQTVGNLCEGKSPRQMAKLRILDPACGSGSFLIGAYQFLLDRHRDWYAEHLVPKVEAEGKIAGRTLRSLTADGKTQMPVYRGRGGQWFLTTAEKRRILLDNIYGVDIDAQAVEVTKLSLLLKVLEGENQETLERQRRLWHERALPDLSSNIKCGNSLIGPDFYDVKQGTLFDEEEQYRINAFDWHAEFPEILGTAKDAKNTKLARRSSGGNTKLARPPSGGSKNGFDAVIGNPPYVRVRAFKELHPAQAAFLERTYTCARHVWDIYLLFFERSLALARRSGYISFIVPIQTLHQPNCESLRQLLLLKTRIESIVDLARLRVFQKAIVKNCILICRKGRRSGHTAGVLQAHSPQCLSLEQVRSWPQDRILENPAFSFKLDLLSPKIDLCEKLAERSWLLSDVCYVTFGLRSCAKGVGKGGKDRLICERACDSSCKPYMEGREIGRYQMRPIGRFIRYLPDEMYSPRTPSLFETKKIMSQSMLSRKRLVATLDASGRYVEQSLVCIIPHGILTDLTPAAVTPLEFVLAVLNSRLESFYFATYIIDYSLGGGLIHATPGAQGKLLVPRCPETQMDSIAQLAKRMLVLHDRLADAKTPDARTRIDREIAHTDKQIDQLVYELYGLTDDEIRIVEEAVEK